MRIIFIGCFVSIISAMQQVPPKQIYQDFDEHALPSNVPSYAKLAENGLIGQAATAYLIQLAREARPLSK